MLAGAFMTVKRGEYLAKARQADEKAAKAKDAHMRTSWQKIAASYREPAQGD
jgi:hypothetical protein